MAPVPVEPGEADGDSENDDVLDPEDRVPTPAPTAWPPAVTLSEPLLPVPFAAPVPPDVVVVPEPEVGIEPEVGAAPTVADEPFVARRPGVKFVD